MARADCLVKLRISCAIYLRATREKMASRFGSVTSEEIILINFFGVHYRPVLVYTKRTIHLSVVSRLGKYPPLATSTSVNSC